MTRKSDPGMRSNGKLSPREGQYSGDGSLWRRRGAGTGASVVTHTHIYIYTYIYIYIQSWTKTLAPLVNMI